MIVLFLPWLLLLLVFVLLLLFYNKKYTLATFTLITVVWVNFYFEVFPINLGSKLTSYTQDKNISILSFNLQSYSKNFKDDRFKLKDLILQTNSDVVFLTEYYSSEQDSIHQELSQTYPYSTLANRHRGNVFYCRYPILNACEVPCKGIPRSMVYECSIQFSDKIIKFYGCHLLSNNFDNGKKWPVDSIKSCRGLLYYLNNIAQSSDSRRKQAASIIKSIDTDHYVVVLGDFNDISGSSTFRQFASAGLTDCWWDSGFGYGATIHRPMPYRIDHILHSSNITSSQTKVYSSNGLSDHDALYTEIQLK